MTTYPQAVANGRQRWGDRFVEPKTTEAQRLAFNGPRVEVTTVYDSGEKFVRRGRISITTGWAPSLLLIHRRGDSGSWDVLNERDLITRVIG